MDLPQTIRHLSDSPWLQRARKDTRTLALAGVTAAALILVGVFVWPTRYRYDSITTGGSTFPVRIDRITGRAEQLRADGWRMMTAPMFSGVVVPEESDQERRWNARQKAGWFNSFELSAVTLEQWTIEHGALGHDKLQFRIHNSSLRRIGYFWVQILVRPKGDVPEQETPTKRGDAPPKQPPAFGAGDTPVPEPTTVEHEWRKYGPYVYSDQPILAGAWLDDGVELDGLPADIENWDCRVELFSASEIMPSEWEAHEGSRRKK